MKASWIMTSRKNADVCIGEASNRERFWRCAVGWLGWRYEFGLRVPALLEDWNETENAKLIDDESMKVYDMMRTIAGSCK